MFEKQVIENPVPLQLYFVESNDTGEREICSLLRGVWNRIHPSKDKPLFFAYENQSVAVSEAYPCSNCSEWCMHPAKYGNNEWCENCVPF